MKRRQFVRAAALGAAAAAGLPRAISAAAPEKAFRLRYILSSAMYGTTALAEILPEVRKAGAEHIDIWPAVHGNQREQVEEMGLDAFEELLARNEVKLGCLTQYPLGPFALAPEMAVAKRFGCELIVTGAKGPKGLKGAEAKAAVKAFAEEIKPHAAAAEAHGVTIAVENHGGHLLDSPDGMKWFAEMAGSKHLGIAFAPHHLPQDGALLGDLIAALGDRMVFFYAQQIGMGSKEKLPKEQELMQMPGRGALDFAPMVAALRKIGFRGFTEIFMHPVPRGVPILETTAKVTAEINRSRDYLDGLIGKV
jgi:sugar phosphate isomerase/epimerase